jgi:dolichol-phosphate mannosyltransferase
MIKAKGNGENIAIITPSYNEADSLRVLLTKIKNSLPKVTVVIVDDSSFKENKKIKDFLKNKKNIILISRKKKMGRGSAILKGFREGLKKKKISFFIEMDSDLAHDPNEIEKFIYKNNNGNYDLIIGSRYAKGGHTFISKQRTILSKFINIFLRLWLGIKVSDFTGGFRFYNRKAISFLTKQRLEATGFITLSEILYKLSKNNFIIGEVPISIHNRIYGKTSFGFSELFSSLIFILKLRFKQS